MNISERLRNLLGSRGISIGEFSEMCNLPLETVRNIYYGKTADPKISTVMQMADALNLSVNCFMGKCTHTSEERAILQHYRSCGNHGRSLILLTAKYEALTAKAERDAVEKHKVPCLIPKGNVYKGIVYENCEVMEMETSQKKAFVAIKMTTNDFVPVYCKGDIVLLENRFPSHDDYAVFYKEGRAYIRKYLEEENGYRLKCLHNMGEDFVLNRMDEIEYVGTCCGVIRGEVGGETKIPSLQIRKSIL